MSNRVALRSFAHARSGDKGADANVGVWTSGRQGYDVLLLALTESVVRAHFSTLGSADSVVRYELPNLFALNFVLVGFLDGGGTSNLRVDAQGKALGLALLELEVEIPTAFANELGRKSGTLTSHHNGN